MDTKALVVGQKVRMVSLGIYSNEGWVAKVTPDGVDVQTGVQQIDGTWNSHELFHFDREGKQCYADGTPARNEEGKPEFEPWELTDIRAEKPR